MKWVAEKFNLASLAFYSVPSLSFPLGASKQEAAQRVATRSLSGRDKIRDLFETGG